MMNKRLVVILMFFFSAFYGYSQVSWNAKAGMNFSRVTGWPNADMKPGYQLGVGMDYFFNDHWGIQPSVMLISKGYKQKGEYYYPSGENAPANAYDRTENRVYIELPVMLAYKFSITDQMNLVINGGGYISYGIAGKYKNKITLEDGSKSDYNYDTFSDGTEKFDTGLGAGATLEFKNKYTIGLFGEWGLKSVIGDFSKNQAYGLNVGYKF